MYKLILAVDKNNGIAKNNKLSWNLKTDLKRFRELTINQNVIMGSKTFESILIALNKPLPSRNNVVLTRDVFYNLKHKEHSFKTVNSIQECLRDYKNGWIIGGKEIYDQFLPYCNEIYLTKISKDYNCDLFCKLDLKDFYINSMLHSRELVKENGSSEFVEFDFINYKRI
jgi:dihydrofolate reductase